MKFRIHHKAVTGSTNQDARAGEPGDVFTADEQTAGRGRLDHRWLSAPGMNLMLSVVLDVAGLPPEQVVTLPLVGGLAVRAAVSRVLGHVPSVSCSLKWPNDVYLADRKVAGILCERQGDWVVVGVGVNVNQVVFAPEIAARATSLKLVRGEACDVAEVRDVFLDELATRYEKWRCAGFALFHAEYAAVDWLKGRQIAVKQTDTDREPLTGICAGVQSDGTLRVGEVSVYAGEVHVMASH